jgi:Zn-dependent protease
MNPLPHIDPIGSVLLPLVLLVSDSPFLFGWARPVPYNPQNLRASWGEAFVAFAGPATNLALAFFFALVTRVAASVLHNELLVTFAVQALTINVVLALFNLIPVPPLDGSKVLAHFLPLAGKRWMANFEASLASWGVAGLAAVLLLLIFVAGEWFSAAVLWVVRFLTGFH